MTEPFGEDIRTVVAGAPTSLTRPLGASGAHSGTTARITTQVVSRAETDAEIADGR